MKAEGMSDAALSAFQRNYDALVSGASTTLSESDIDVVDSLPYLKEMPGQYQTLMRIRNFSDINHLDIEFVLPINLNSGCIFTPIFYFQTHLAQFVSNFMFTTTLGNGSSWWHFGARSF